MWPYTQCMKELAVALGLTLVVQAMVSAAVFAPAVLAPAVQADAGVAASAIGIFTAIIYGTAAFAAPLGGTFIARFGAVRVSQCCLMFAGGGLALCALAHPAALVAGALLIGCGQGPVTPASSEILATRTPARIRNLIISIRQTGVPIGGAVAGAVLPVLILAAGWKVAVLVVAAVNVVGAFAMQPVRDYYDSARHDALTKPRASLVSLLRMVFAHAGLRQGALASFTYGGMQMCLASFLVVFLTERAGLTLVNAGLALSAAMLGGIVGRVLWGLVADFVGSARLVLGALGIGMALSAFVLSQVTPGWPLFAIIALCSVFGMAALGWNGVYIAEIARIAPEGKVAIATGASLAFTFIGVVVGPPCFWLTVALSDSYALAFALLGAVTLAASTSYFRELSGSAGRER